MSDRGDRAAERMTIREHFAGQAMQGLLASEAMSGVVEDLGGAQRVSEAAVVCANALLEELGKGGQL